MFSAVTPMWPCPKGSCSAPVIASTTGASPQGPSARRRNRRSPCAFPKPPLPRGWSLQSPVQIVLAGALDQDRGELADPGAALEAHYAVDLRCVGAGAAQPRLIDDDFQGPAYLRLQPGGTDRRLRLHQPASPLFSHLVGNGVRQSVGSGSCHRRVSKAADAIQLGLLQEFQ